jgi:hypothetical protein
MSEFGFGAIDAWPSTSLVLGLGKGKEGHAVGSHPSDQMMSVLEQAASEVARSIVGVGDPVRASVQFKPSNKRLNLESKVRRSRLDQTNPSWIRAAMGTPKRARPLGLTRPRLGRNGP